MVAREVEINQVLWIEESERSVSRIGSLGHLEVLCTALAFLHRVA